MVGILGVLRDTPDYKRFSRAGRLVEDAKYTGDSGIFNRNLSYVPLMDPDDLLDRHRTAVETLNSPEIFFERCMTHFDHRGRRPIKCAPLRLQEVKAFFRSLWRQGVVSGYGREYWKYLGKVMAKYPTSLPDAIRLAVQGHHLIVTTQQALHVDEVKTFFDEALEHLEHYCAGYRDAFQQNVGAYASRLMRTIHNRFEHFNDDRSTLQHNSAVLLKAAQDSYAAVREEFRHQVREPLERFQREIERLVETYTGDEGSLPQQAP
jgi:hypothetical protein